MTTDTAQPKPKTVAFLGPVGTFTEHALNSQPDLAKLLAVPLPKFADVLDAVTNGDADLGIVAIENAIEGAVNITIDALTFDHELMIQREIVIDVELNLLAKPGAALQDIHTVYSHPVASAQCRDFLRQNLPNADIKPANSTADGAKLAATNAGVGALAPTMAAEHNKLDTLAKNVADHKGNKTRFVVVAKHGIPAVSGHDKTSVVLTEREDKPGLLVTILEEFAARTINLTHLSSRPIKTALGTYCFVIDFDGHIGDHLVADCLRSIHAKHADVKFLGSYPAGRNGSTKISHEKTKQWAKADEWIKTLRAQISE